MKKRTEVPARVTLRDERVRVREWARVGAGLHSLRVLEHEEYHPYSYDVDEELEELLARTNGDPLMALKAWFAMAFESDGATRHGIHLIPGPIKYRLRLPVRQVYVFSGHIYRIDPEEDGVHGRVNRTDPLL